MSCSHLEKPTHRIRKLAGKLLTKDVLQDCDAASIVYVLDALGKIHTKDRVLAETLSNDLARWAGDTRVNHAFVFADGVEFDRCGLDQESASSGSEFNISGSKADFPHGAHNWRSAAVR